jgi:NADH:ubiquinone oxidoreductase subunit 2 (subunit N)
MDFKKALMLMKDKVHLTDQGLVKILAIKNCMNTKRLMSTLTTAPLILPQNNKLVSASRYSSFPQTVNEYPLIILFILIGAILLMSSNDLVSMFLAIELQSYGLYIFATLYRDSELSTSAGLTYFLLGGLSSCFILLGSLGESGLLLSGPQLPNYGKPLKPSVPTVGRNSIRG